MQILSQLLEGPYSRSKTFWEALSKAISEHLLVWVEELYLFRYFSGTLLDTWFGIQNVCVTPISLRPSPRTLSCPGRRQSSLNTSTMVATTRRPFSSPPNHSLPMLIVTWACQKHTRSLFRLLPVFLLTSNTQYQNRWFGLDELSQFCNAFSPRGKVISCNTAENAFKITGGLFYVEYPFSVDLLKDYFRLTCNSCYIRTY